jgi:3-dehydroquinate synthase
MAEIQVRTAGGAYPVHVGHGLYEEELARDLMRIRPARVVLVSHPSIFELHGGRLSAALDAGKGGPGAAFTFLFPEGEGNKDLRTLEEGYLALLKSGITREDILLAFGGGVVGDLAGFLASTYMRGIRYLQLPTTLMSMVDSGIGGKVGVDMPGAKNAVGSFYQPLAVYCDIATLITLPGRELRSGLAEVAKYGFLYDAGLLRILEGWPGGLPGPGDDLAGVVAGCAGHKARVVSADERDLSGERALLNYGHTFGHALESACGYGELRHGEAVAVGMMMAARLAELTGFARRDLSEQHRRVLMPLLGDGSLHIDPDQDRVLADMQTDKKKGERLRFVLLEEMQAPRLIEEIPERFVKSAVEDTLEMLRRAGLCN